MASANALAVDGLGHGLSATGGAYHIPAILLWIANGLRYI